MATGGQAKLVAKTKTDEQENEDEFSGNAKRYRDSISIISRHSMLQLRRTNLIHRCWNRHTLRQGLSSACATSAYPRISFSSGYRGDDDGIREFHVDGRRAREFLLIIFARNLSQPATTPLTPPADRSISSFVVVNVRVLVVVVFDLLLVAIIKRVLLVFLLVFVLFAGFA